LTEADALPSWPPGTVAILSTAAGPPHAIPVSTAVPAGPRRVLIALALGRESLARLRSDPRAALTILAEGNVAVTAHVRARIVQEPMAAADGVAAVVLDVERIQDHGQPRFEIESGARWHWTDEESLVRDSAIRAALVELAAELDDRRG
jgi:hypothetical protein